MKKLETVKAVGGIIIGTGVSAIVSGAIKDATSEETGKVKKFCIGVTGLVLVGMACEKVIRYFEGKVDSIAEGSKKVEEVEPEKKEEKTV